MTAQGDILFLESSKNMGGQEWQLLQQMQALEECGYRCTLLCRPDARIFEEARNRRLQVTPLPFRNSAHLPTIAAIRNIIRAQRPLACICHSGHDSNNLSLSVLMMRQRPKIIRSRTYDTAKGRKRFQSLLPMDAVMVPSRFMQQQIQRQYPDKPVITVYPGIDFERLDQQSKEALPAPLETWLQARSGHRILIQVGMLRTEKGHMITLAALAAVLQKRQDVSLIIAGSGFQQAAIEAEIERLGLGSHVWLGELKPVAPALVKSHLLLMPSLQEPLGMAQTEALGLGIPVLVSSAGGLPETVAHRETGLVADSFEPEAWAGHILAALADYPLMQQYAAAGKEQVRSRFGKTANTRQLIELIRA